MVRLVLNPLYRLPFTSHKLHTVYVQSKSFALKLIWRRSFSDLPNNDLKVKVEQLTATNNALINQLQQYKSKIISLQDLIDQEKKTSKYHNSTTEKNVEYVDCFFFISQYYFDSIII